MNSTFFSLDVDFPKVGFLLDDFKFLDNIITTTIDVDLETGNLIWTIPDNLSSENSTILSLVDGCLVATYEPNDSFDTATLRINSDSYLLATT
jgi:hypothetical protein